MARLESESHTPLERFAAVALEPAVAGFAAVRADDAVEIDAIPLDTVGRASVTDERSGRMRDRP